MNGLVSVFAFNYLLSIKDSRYILGVVSSYTINGICRCFKYVQLSNLIVCHHRILVHSTPSFFIDMTSNRQINLLDLMAQGRPTFSDLCGMCFIRCWSWVNDVTGQGSAQPTKYSSFGTFCQLSYPFESEVTDCKATDGHKAGIGLK